MKHLYPQIQLPSFSFLPYRSIYRTLLFFSFFTISIEICSAQDSQIPDLMKEAGLFQQEIQTESGPQLFAYPEFATDGANFDKIFAQKLGTTLWSNSRRVKCYTTSLLIAAQFPVIFNDKNSEEINEQLNSIGKFVGMSASFLSWLNERQTNYRPNSNVVNEIDNFISKYVRLINPKSSQGVIYKFTNLNVLSTCLKGFQIGSIAQDFAYKASVREALATDMAYSRLLYIEQVIINRQHFGIKVDPAIFLALTDAKKTLLRSQEYYGALFSELESRYGEVVIYGPEIALAMVKKNVISAIAKNISSVGTSAAKTQANAAFGLWTWSLFLTYETICGLLEQHEDLQVAITSATLSAILTDELNKGRIEDNDLTKAIRWHCDYGYYSQMVQLTKGALPWWRDQVDNVFYNHKYYKEAQTCYEFLLDKINVSILRLKFFVDRISQNESNICSICLIIDSSGSMKESDAEDMRKTVIKEIVESVDGVNNLFLIDFDDESKWLNSSNYHNWEISSLFKDIEGINSDGGTNLGLSLAKAKEVLTSTQSTNNAGVLLLSDGMGDYNNEAIWFKENNIPVFTISLQGKINEQLMSQIAQSTGGEYYKAYSEYDIIEAYISFMNRMLNQNIIFSSKNKRIPTTSSITEEFWIDSDISFFRANLFTGFFNEQITVTEPDGLKVFLNSSEYDIISGEHYTIFKVPTPKVGKWKVEITKTDLDADTRYWFLITGKQENSLQCKLNYNVTNSSMSLSYPVSDPTMKYSIQNQEINVKTPLGKVVKINNPNSDIVRYIPGDGPGSYKFEIGIRGIFNGNSQFQRYFSKTIFVEGDILQQIPKVNEMTGNYLFANIGKTNGIEHGMKCNVYRISNSDEILVGSGNIINIANNKITIEILSVNDIYQPKLNDLIVIINPLTDK